MMLFKLLMKHTGQINLNFWYWFNWKFYDLSNVKEEWFGLYIAYAKIMDLVNI